MVLHTIIHSVWRMNTMSSAAAFKYFVSKESFPLCCQWKQPYTELDDWSIKSLLFAVTGSGSPGLIITSSVILYLEVQRMES